MFIPGGESFPYSDLFLSVDQAAECDTLFFDSLPCWWHRHYLEFRLSIHEAFNDQWLEVVLHYGVDDVILFLYTALRERKTICRSLHKMIHTYCLNLFLILFPVRICTHRHSLTSMQTADSWLGFLMRTKFDKGAPCKKIRKSSSVRAGIIAHTYVWRKSLNGL